MHSVKMHLKNVLIYITQIYSCDDEVERQNALPNVFLHLKSTISIKHLMSVIFLTAFSCGLLGSLTRDVSYHT